ncbi:hypothetical protein Clacol_002578 [Clathrus columnatus]|uniref:MICOS complex subunit MIC60 n=1 Tax=Clathrus columnatus TaxID=1419009 RepID=A0AAV5A6J6_9AGAM|nr:hypothetical protein Clacol_002578 [Clathrus columnatus]
MKPLSVTVRHVLYRRTGPHRVRQQIRRLATEATGVPKKSSVLRRILLFSTLTFGLYGTGTLVALRNEQFHDIFVEYIPYGDRLLKFAEQWGWEGHSLEPEAVLKAGRAAIERIERAANDSVTVAHKWVDKAREKSAGNTQRSPSTSSSTVPIVNSEPTQAEVQGESVVVTKEEPHQKTEEDLETPVTHPEATFTEVPLHETEKMPVSLEPNVYTAELPLGFEAPPGYVLSSQQKSISQSPEPVKSEAPIDIPKLPLVAPVVDDLASSEPVLSQLANTIDHLASFLAENPSVSVNSNIKQALEAAQEDLIALGQRFQVIKDQEKANLEEHLEEKARDYSLQLLQLELAAQDRLDQQGEEWRKFAEQERQQLIHAYRAKLEAELQAQSEIINQRLKEEVIAQGIELQRRWIREIKVRVENERGNRLAKLNELTADVKRLSRVTLDNSDYLEENLRLHALWSSIRSLQSLVQDSTARKPFREELRTLRHVVLAGGGYEDPLLFVALQVLEDSDTPDVGVEPLADLASWFTTSVAPRICNVSLVPDENAGLFSYLASSALSLIRVKRQGLVEGNDVYDVVSRAEYFMNEKDLDNAARELNQLRGPAKLLLHDWLEAARRRLEVLQALEVRLIVKIQATLSSLLLVK